MAENERPPDPPPQLRESSVLLKGHGGDRDRVREGMPDGRALRSRPSVLRLELEPGRRRIGRYIFRRLSPPLWPSSSSDMQLQQLSECRRAARLHFGLAFTDDAQGAAVAQAGLDVDSNIYSDPLQPRQPPYRPTLLQTIMREHLGQW